MGVALNPFLYFRRNPGRTAPMMLVIALAVVLVASVVTIVNSIDLTVYTLYGYNRVMTGITPRNALEVAEPEVDKIRKLPELGRLFPSRSYNTMVKTIFGKLQFPIFGLSEEGRNLVLQRTGLRIVAGRMVADGQPEVVISKEIAKNLGLKVGDVLAKPESEDSFAPVPVRLVGLLDGPVWLGLTSKSLVDSTSPFNITGYVAFSKADDEASQRRLDDAIVRVADKSKMRIWRFAGLVRETKSALSNLYLILDIVITIIVIAISFVCGLLSNIYFTQRLPEVATLSAIGYPRGALLRRAFSETALLCALGWFVGAGFTIGLMTVVRAVFLAPRGLVLNPLDPRAYLTTLPLPVTITLFAVLTISIRLSALDPVSIIERRG